MESLEMLGFAGCRDADGIAGSSRMQILPGVGGLASPERMYPSVSSGRGLLTPVRVFHPVYPDKHAGRAAAETEDTGEFRCRREWTEILIVSHP